MADSIFNFSQWFNKDLLHQSAANVLVDLTTGSPNIAVVAPSIAKGEHVPPPTDEQLATYYENPNALVDEIARTSWNNYVYGITSDIQTNTPEHLQTDNASFPDIPGMPKKEDLVTVIVFVAISLIGLQLFKR
jgi:hypothetical protein